MNVRDGIRNEPSSFYLSIGRLLLGFSSLFGAIDKMFGIRMTTPELAFINGGSPCKGFLMGVSNGPLGFLFEPLVDVSRFVDAIIILALFLMGVALLLGIGRKLCCILGAVLMFIFYLASLPIVEIPFVDFHLIYVAFLLALYHSKSFSILGFGDQWKEIALVKRYPILE